MQSVSSRIWTRVAESTSCDDNHYTTGTSTIMDILYIFQHYNPRLRDRIIGFL